MTSKRTVAAYDNETAAYLEQIDAADYDEALLTEPHHPECAARPFAPCACSGVVAGDSLGFPGCRIFAVAAVVV